MAPTTLRVALFPYIPDAGGDQYRRLSAWIESTFEARNPGVDLQLRPLDPQGDDFYNIDTTLAGWLADGPGAYDVVEIDASVLGDLVARRWVQPWPARDSLAWHPAARVAVRRGAVTYGVPHWLCSYFVFTRQDAVHRAASITNLVQALNASAPGKPAVLVGNFKGSWETPGYYLDAYGEVRGWQAVPAALSPILDTTVLHPLLRLFRQCVGQHNPCLFGAYEADSVAPRIFARDSAVALVGYSERLHYVQSFLPPGQPPVLVSAAPLGTGNTPVLFVDLLVKNTRCQQACSAAADAFAAFLNDPAVVVQVVLSGEAGVGATPRYLLPATLAPYFSAPLGTDPYYRTLWLAIEHAGPLPNVGVTPVHRAMRDSIVAAYNRLP
jgi:thiamine pyridinylase